MIATNTALKLADYVVTEAGFGADLGAEKFFNIKCRKGDLKPDAVVLVATTKALKMHGGVAKDALDAENVAAVVAGCANLGRHIRNIAYFGVPVTVTINRYTNDTADELQAIADFCKRYNVPCSVSSHWRDGGEGAVELAEQVVNMTKERRPQFRPLYGDDVPLWGKTRRIARSIYGADDIMADKKIRDQFADYQASGFGGYPICMAKTQYSFSTDPQLLGAPEGHNVKIREVRIATGAEFLVAICGAIMTMPGLPRTPASENIDVDDKGQITGLF